MSATIRFKSPYDLKKTKTPAQDFVSEVREANETKPKPKITTWQADAKVKIRLRREIRSLSDADGKPATYVGAVDVEHETSDAKSYPNGRLVAVTVFGDALVTRCKDDAKATKFAHHTLASEFVQLVLQHFPDLAPASTWPHK